jgi:penicillin-binding protein-related factor A (putative recombinase)
MKEAVFITDIVNSLKEQGCAFVYKPPDSPASWTQSMTRFTAPKPCDIITADKKGLILIECKQIRKWEAFSEYDMRPSQVKALGEAKAMGQKAYVFLNVRVTAERVNVLLIFNWSKLCEIWGSQKGCIRAKEIRERCESSQAIHGLNGRYDVSAILDL